MTVYTAIFGGYDTLKEPAIVTPGWQYVCITDRPPAFQTTWQIVQTHPPFEPRKSARYFKINFHKVIKDDICLYVDPSFVINVSLTNFWIENFKPPMTCMRHPLRDCIYQEAKAIIDAKRGGSEKLVEQICDYASAGVPGHAGLIQSGIMMRDRSRPVIQFCEAWWKQLDKYSLRDQVSFSMVAHTLVARYIHYIDFDYRASKDFIYKKHIPQ